MISINEPDEQKERLKARLADQIKEIRAGIEQLKKVKISAEDFTSLQDALTETAKLGQQVKGEDFSFLKDQLDEIGKLKDETKQDKFDIQEELREKGKGMESESQVSSIQEEIGTLQDSVRRLALRSYLREDLKNIETRMGSLKIKEDDRNSLDTELAEKTNRVISFEEDDDTQLFILRREIGLLKENVEGLAVKRKFWSRISMGGWIAIVTLPLVLYFIWLSFVQWRNSDQIYYYPGTQTAVAQTAVASQTVMPGALGIGTVTPSPP